VRSIACYLSASVEEQSQSTAAISRGIEEAAQVASAILSDVMTMSRSAHETGEAAEGVTAVAQELTDASTRLGSEMIAFEERMRAA
jgi:methyl-accepting chemotaxis protein